MARRNANGEGTIYRRQDGRYEGAVYVLTSNGTRKRVRVYGATRAEVSKKLTEAKAKNDQGIPVADKTWKLGEYLDYWLKEVIKPNRRATTYDLYEGNVRLYLKPGLGHLTLNKLSVPTLQTYLNRQLAAGQSVRKVQTLREVVSSALTQAMREEQLTRNVAQLVTVRETYGEGEEVWPWSSHEAKQFLEAAKVHHWFPAFLLSVLYGMRRGEVLGLRWQDIDFVHQRIYIRQQVFRAGGKVQIGPVKTKAGQRTLPLLGVVADVLREHHERQTPSEGGLNFTTSTGGPIEPQNYSRAFLHLCAKFGMRRIKLHHLRHGAATLMKELGVPDKDIQLILGHSSVAITQKIYQHASMESRFTALTLMTEAVSSASPISSQMTAQPDGNTDSQDSEGCRQNCRQTPTTPSLSARFNFADEAKNKPTTGVPAVGWLDNFLGDLTENRTPIARMKIRNRSVRGSVRQRATEVDAFLQDSRRRWLLGVVAVNVAVKDTRGEEAELAA
ncbi:tyrosine-type recombinase/integrase [Streptomyces sp. NBC_01439]|uniref:tyrosine-type recombinase/integrase n=1 Tax=Streptomyces sp. NBC_01439 TaxID=2903867 RepID=UPI002E2A6018|nr:site-specific integrase [Streptomyces sp. NBC_01439]